VAESEIARYDFDGRQIKAHRAEIRRELGLRECSVRDAEQLTAWLAEHVCERERHPDVVRDELLARCRATGVEPPARTRVERIVASALRRAEDALFARVASRPGVVARVEALIGAADDGDLEDADDMSVFAAIRADPGGVSLNTMLAEAEKLLAVRAVRLPAEMFADVAPRILGAWRAGAAAEAPSHLSRAPRADARGAGLRVAVGARAGDHRHARRPAELDGAQDQRARGDTVNALARRSRVVAENTSSSASPGAVTNSSAPRSGPWEEAPAGDARIHAKAKRGPVFRTTERGSALTGATRRDPALASQDSSETRRPVRE